MPKASTHPGNNIPAGSLRPSAGCVGACCRDPRVHFVPSCAILANEPFWNPRSFPSFDGAQHGGQIDDKCNSKNHIMQIFAQTCNNIDKFWALWGPLWATRGQFHGPSRVILGHLGGILGPFLCHPGPSWARGDFGLRGPPPWQTPKWEPKRAQKSSKK